MKVNVKGLNPYVNNQVHWLMWRQIYSEGLEAEWEEAESFGSCLKWIQLDIETENREVFGAIPSMGVAVSGSR